MINTGPDGHLHWAHLYTVCSSTLNSLNINLNQFSYWNLRFYHPVLLCFFLLPLCSVVVFIRLSSSVTKQPLISSVTASPVPISQVIIMMGPFPPFKWTWMLSCTNTHAWMYPEFQRMFRKMYHQVLKNNKNNDYFTHYFNHATFIGVELR